MKEREREHEIQTREKIYIKEDRAIEICRVSDVLGI